MCAILQIYTKQELEKSGFVSSLIFGKPAKNAWAAINNLLADADCAQAVSAEAIKKAAKEWGVKFNDANEDDRAAIYRKLADAIFAEIQTKDDELLKETDHLAAALELSENKIKASNKASRIKAYFTRCRKLIDGTEKLSIDQINELFGYDYEDGLSVRRQVFAGYFNKEFEEISARKRYTDEDEAKYQGICKTLDIPYEFKLNMQNAIDHYRALYNAETKELGELPLELPVDMLEGEVCKAYSRCGICQDVEVERTDDYFEMTRKFKIDETVTFTNDKLDMPKSKEEVTTVVAVGDFVLTNKRILVFTEKQGIGIPLEDIESSELDDVKNHVTFHTKNGKSMFYIYTPDEENGPQPMADVMYLLVERVRKEGK